MANVSFIQLDATPACNAPVSVVTEENVQHLPKLTNLTRLYKDDMQISLKPLSAIFLELMRNLAKFCASLIELCATLLNFKQKHGTNFPEFCHFWTILDIYL